MKQNRHGLSKTSIYSIYKNMKKRCYNPNNPKYSSYGGRGITICKEWLEDFVNFYNWSVENGYSDELTIDRIDGTKGYSPDNCRWTTWEEQWKDTGRPKSDNPKSSTVNVRVNGEMIKQIEEYCFKNNISKAEAARRAFEMLLQKEIEQ